MASLSSRSSVSLKPARDGLQKGPLPLQGEPVGLRLLVGVACGLAH
jgi:hypothetical protein